MLTLLTSVYFASMLIVGGIAKFRDTGNFSSALNIIRLLPYWVIRIASKAIPCFEVCFGLALLSGIAPTITASLNLALFIGFFSFKATLFSKKDASDCGCFGSLYKRKIDLASLTTSFVLILLAILHLWLTIWITPAHIVIRVAVVIATFIISCMMLLQIAQRQRIAFRIIRS